jgi:hypothetical protein
LYTGGSGGPCFWLASFLVLLVLGMPCIIVFNVFVTPVYMFGLLFWLFGVRRQRIDGRVCMMTVMGFTFVLLYSAVPIIFFIVTLPQLTFHFAKKYHELKDLCRSRCRRYRKLTISPVNNRLMRFIGVS